MPQLATLQYKWAAE